MIEIIKQAVSDLRFRVESQGLDLELGDISPKYSRAYKLRKKKSGRASSFVNLSFFGTMWAGFGRSDSQGGDPARAVASFANKPDVAYHHDVRYRFFGWDTNMIEQAREIFELCIQDWLNDL